MNKDGSPDLVQVNKLLVDKSLVNLKTNLKYLIKARSLNILKLSRETKLAKSTIADWCSGISPKNIEHIKILADYFKLSVDQLVFEKDPSNFTKAEQSKKETLELIPFGKYDVYLKKI